MLDDSGDGALSTVAFSDYFGKARATPPRLKPSTGLGSGEEGCGGGAGSVLHKPHQLELKPFLFQEEAGQFRCRL